MGWLIKMTILNLYYSSTGNTEKVAKRIHETVQELGYDVGTLRVTGGDMDVDLLRYDLVFVGSGVYGQLPGEPLMEFHRKLSRKYGRLGEIKHASPRRPSKKVVVYCTYGGAHTDVNEGVPAVKYMGQLYDHLGYTIVAEWYVVGEYESAERSMEGRLGDIRGRPNENDLRDVAGKVKGIVKASSF